MLLTRGVFHLAACQSPAKVEPLSDKLPFFSLRLFLFLVTSFLFFFFLVFSFLAHETWRCPGEVLFFCDATWFVPCSEVAFNRVKRYEDNYINRKSGVISICCCFPLFCFVFQLPIMLVSIKRERFMTSVLFPSKSIPFAPESLLFFAFIFYFHFDIQLVTCFLADVPFLTVHLYNQTSENRKSTLFLFCFLRVEMFSDPPRWRKRKKQSGISTEWSCLVEGSRRHLHCTILLSSWLVFFFLTC